VEHEERLRQRDEEEAKRKEELRNNAIKELQEWSVAYFAPARLGSS